MNYLSLCGTIERRDGWYEAPLQQQLYRYERKGAYQSEMLPLYLILEALAQIGCRSAAQELHTNARIIPVQLRKCSFELEHAPQEGNYRLRASCKDNGRQTVMLTELLSGQQKTIASAELWVSVMGET
jgi:hypothetical protein